MPKIRLVRERCGRRNAACLTRAACAVLGLFAGTAVAGPAGISGDVRDEAENPVGGATVVLIDDNCAGGGGTVEELKSAARVCSESASTSSDGKFSFASRAYFNAYTIVVSHVAHEIWRAHLSENMDREHVRVTLHSSDAGLKTVETASASQLAKDSDGLKILGEPALCSDDRVGSGKTGYRFIWWRAFSPYVVVEIDMGTGAAQPISLRYKEWGRNKPAKSITRSVTEDVKKKWQVMKQADRKDPQLASEIANGYFEKEADNELRSIREKQFAEVWDLPYLREPENFIVLDGSSWVIEAIKDRRCHVVKRSSPAKENAVRRLAENLLGLSRQPLNYFDVY
jgi:hypothetical protein